MTRKRLTLTDTLALERLHTRLYEDAQHIRLVRKRKRTIASLTETAARLHDSRQLILKILGGDDAHS